MSHDPHRCRRRRHCWGASTRTGMAFLQACLGKNPLWVHKSERRRRRSEASTGTCTSPLDTQLENQDCEISTQSLTLRRRTAVMSRQAWFYGRMKHGRASVLERFPLMSSLSGTWSILTRVMVVTVNSQNLSVETFNVQGTDVPWHGARVYNSESFR